eukprot:scpid34778/ scgid34820/ Peptidyl-glycine alpha-amidating monooxygenase A; Peptide C-terminal alpha-amidating enzyme I; Peptidyl-glycine alpha-amidating monooxygenase I; Peptidylglycine alpha-hydroxylating monooxygenase A; Peptidyl-alpha-hydroxyglycine alpha-amidating lyase A; Peptidylamidoglycolate lyase-A
MDSGRLLALFSVSVLCSTVHVALSAESGTSFTAQLSGVLSSRLDQDGLTYCVHQELGPAAKFISALSLDVPEHVSKVRVFLDSTSQYLYPVPSSCPAFSIHNGQLLFVWHPGSSKQLLLAKVGAGDAGFPVPKSRQFVLLEVTYMPTSPVPSALPKVSANLLLSDLPHTWTSGIATVNAKVMHEQAVGRDHVISACQYKQQSTLQPILVYWDASAEVTHINLYVMDQRKHTSKIATVWRNPAGELAVSKLPANADELKARNFMAIKCFFNSSQARKPLQCSANVLYEARWPAPIHFYCNNTFNTPLKGTPMKATTETGGSHRAKEIDNPLLDMRDTFRDPISSHFAEIDWMQESGGVLPATMGGSSIGPVSGVAVNPLNNHVLAVHTSDKSMQGKLFNANGIYLFADEGPIAGDAVLELDPRTGEVIKSWGKNFFYLPHGIFVDHLGRVWITDRAKHQVFGFRQGLEKPFLTLGDEFIPGTGDYQFCKPTDIAVSSSTGAVFIADGHCNSRILKYSGSGHLLANWALRGGDRSSVLHSIALSPGDDLVCFAVSTSSEIYCVDQFSGALMKSFKNAELPVPADGIAFGAHWSNGHNVLHVIGGGSHGNPVTGISLDFTSSKILDKFTPAINAQGLSVAHDVAVSKDGLDLFVANLALGKVLKFTRRSPFDVTKKPAVEEPVSTPADTEVALTTDDADEKAVPTNGAAHHSSVSSHEAAIHKTTGEDSSKPATSAAADETVQPVSSPESGDTSKTTGGETELSSDNTKTAVKDGSSSSSSSNV